MRMRMMMMMMMMMMMNDINSSGVSAEAWVITKKNAMSFRPPWFTLGDGSFLGRHKLFC